MSAWTIAIDLDADQECRRCGSATAPGRENRQCDLCTQDDARSETACYSCDNEATGERYGNPICGGCAAQWERLEAQHMGAQS